MEFYGFSDDMFSSSQKIDFHSFKNGEHRFRVLPPFAPNQLFYKVDLHWGYTDENNKKKVFKCTKYTHKMCPICDEVDRLNAEIEMAKKNPAGFSSPEEMQMTIGEKEKRIGDIRRKPTYLWNIITEEGQAKVLQLSWNGHDPLWNKIKWLWENQKINVTDPRASQQMWCARTGTNAKTRYQYELVMNSTRQLENLPPIIDLSKVYAEQTPAELKQVVELGYVRTATEDPNDRSFVAQMQATPNLNQYQPQPNVPSQPVNPMPAQQMGNVPVQQATNQFSNQATTQVNGVQNHSNIGQNVQQNAFPSNQPQQVAQPAAPNVDDDIAKMAAILNS